MAPAPIGATRQTSVREVLALRVEAPLDIAMERLEAEVVQLLTAFRAVVVADNIIPVAVAVLEGLEHRVRLRQMVARDFPVTLQEHSCIMVVVEVVQAILHVVVMEE